MKRNAEIGLPTKPPSKQRAKKQASARQPRRAAIWNAQHIGQYVSIYKSRATLDHGLRR
jgi:hypothetical protein